MRYACVLVLVSALLAIGGCSSTADGPEVKGRGPESLEGSAAPGPWNKYLQVMSERERMEFLNIMGDDERTLWLRRHGIDVRAELAQKLNRGMSVEAVERVLHDPLDHVEARSGAVTRHYSRFNTASRTNYYLTFRADQLMSWNTYTREQQDRQMGLIRFEAELMRTFDTVLERGMGMSAVQQLALNAGKYLDEVELAHREALNDSERTKDVDGRTVRAHSPDTSDYLVDESVLLAEARYNVYAWLYDEVAQAPRQPDKKVVHRPFETHRYYVTYRSVRGETELVTVEFVYRDGLLENWFVYHDE